MLFDNTLFTLAVSWLLVEREEKGEEEEEERRREGKNGGSYVYYTGTVGVYGGWKF